MGVDSVTAFVDLLREHRLLAPEQLDELARAVQPKFTDPRLLAKQLMQRGWLTVYQVNLIFQDRAGELTLGHYRVLDQLGQGGVSQVFKAWDMQANRQVALKVIRDELIYNPEAFGRFQREMQTAAQLSHPNIVQAFDVDFDRHFFAMEYVEGTDLGRLVQLSGPLPVARACDYIRQVAIGLQHAHERGLVHRDIKPANLLVTAPAADGVVKILDMGLARLNQPAGSDPNINLTREGAMIGTPDYLSPEQARNARVADIRADIYSLGCTFYYLLTGQPPFAGGSLMEKLFKHQKVDPPRIETLRPDIPKALADALHKMMAKKPEDRYQLPRDVVKVLNSYC